MAQHFSNTFFKIAEPQGQTWAEQMETAETGSEEGYETVGAANEQRKKQREQRKDEKQDRTLLQNEFLRDISMLDATELIGNQLTCKEVTKNNLVYPPGAAFNKEMRDVTNKALVFDKYTDMTNYPYVAICVTTDEVHNFWPNHKVVEDKSKKQLLNFCSHVGCKCTNKNPTECKHPVFPFKETYWRGVHTGVIGNIYDEKNPCDGITCTNPECPAKDKHIADPELCKMIAKGQVPFVLYLLFRKTVLANDMAEVDAKQEKYSLLEGQRQTLHTPAQWALQVEIKNQKMPIHLGLYYNTVFLKDMQEMDIIWTCGGSKAIGKITDGKAVWQKNADDKEQERIRFLNQEMDAASQLDAKKKLAQSGASWATYMPSEIQTTETKTPSAASSNSASYPTSKTPSEAGSAVPSDLSLAKTNKGNTWDNQAFAFVKDVMQKDQTTVARITKGHKELIDSFVFGTAGVKALTTFALQFYLEEHEITDEMDRSLFSMPFTEVNLYLPLTTILHKFAEDKPKRFEAIMSSDDEKKKIIWTLVGRFQEIMNNRKAYLTAYDDMTKMHLNMQHVELLRKIPTCVESIKEKFEALEEPKE